MLDPASDNVPYNPDDYYGKSVKRKDNCNYGRYHPYMIILLVCCSIVAILTILWIKHNYYDEAYKHLGDKIYSETATLVASKTIYTTSIHDTSWTFEFQIRYTNSYGLKVLSSYNMTSLKEIEYLVKLYKDNGLDAQNLVDFYNLKIYTLNE